MNKMQLDDFVVLGRTVPEDSKRYGKRICMAGYSEQNSAFVRIYPLMLPVGQFADANKFKARHQYAVSLRRNEHDSRLESWRVEDELHPTTTLWDRSPEISKSRVTEWLSRRVAPSIRSLNECRLSLGVLRLDRDEWDGVLLSRNDREVIDNTPSIFDNLAEQDEFDANHIEVVPYIRFSDRDGEHRLQVREWGAYRLLANEKYAKNPDALWGAPGYRTGHDLLAVVGNMCNHRNSWLVIKTFELATVDTLPNLFTGVVPQGAD